MSIGKILHIGLCATGEPYNGLQLAMIRNCIEYREINCDVANINRVVIDTCYEFIPDIVFIQVQKGGVIHEETLRCIKVTGAWICNWTGDVRSTIPKFYYDFAKYIDVTLFSNQTDVNTFRNSGLRSEYLEIGINESIYTPIGEKKEVKPIVFFGNNYGTGYFPMSQFRIQMVEFMSSKFPSEFGVYGNGWKKSNGNFNSSQYDEAAAYRGSKIAINVSHFEYERYSSDRMLRILGSGPLCLAKWYPGIEQDFFGGTYLRTWRTLQELKELCEYYMKPENEIERLTIAEQGQKHCHAHFTFENMIQNMIKIYNNK